MSVLIWIHFSFLIQIWQWKLTIKFETSLAISTYVHWTCTWWRGLICMYMIRRTLNLHSSSIIWLSHRTFHVNLWRSDEIVSMIAASQMWNNRTTKNWQFKHHKMTFLQTYLITNLEYSPQCPAFALLVKWYSAFAPARKIRLSKHTAHFKQLALTW